MPATLRVSLLTECQYDCAYCRPGALRAARPRRELLGAAEYRRLAPLFRDAGVARVRFTGGEPALRADLPQIVRAFRDAMPDADLALTTNGFRLAQRLDALAEAGLRRATVHVDSLDPVRYRALMGDGEVAATLAAVLAARDVLDEVKLNVVVQAGRNDDELGAFLAWSAEHGVEVRFIELMDTGSAAAHVRETFCSGREILSRLGPVTPLGRRSPSDPAALYRSREGVLFGVIASDTEPFCGACTRLRLTSTGLLRGCLYQEGGAPLGAALRRGAGDDELRELIRTAWAEKRSHHPRTRLPRAPFSMAETGG